MNIAASRPRFHELEPSNADELLKPTHFVKVMHNIFRGIKFKLKLLVLIFEIGQEGNNLFSVKY